MERFLCNTDKLKPPSRLQIAAGSFVLFVSAD
jgi:hypothetical protein